jgi:hypothetical protein
MITSIRRQGDSPIALNKPALGYTWHFVVRQAVLQGWTAGDIIEVTVDGVIHTHTLVAGSTYSLEATRTS